MFSVTYNLAVVAFVAITGSFTFGFANSCIGSIQGLDSFLEYFSISETGQYSNTIRGALSGVFAGGSGIGALVLSSITDRWGRVRTLQLTALLCIIGGVIQTSSINVTMLLVGRAISGFGVGMIVALVPIYQSEISPPESRGFLVSSHGVFIVTGYALSAWIGYAVYFSSNPQFQWRFTLAAQIISPLALLCGSPKIPESPRWLIVNGRKQEAFKILCDLHNDGTNGDQHMTARKELLQITEQCALDRQMEERLGKWALLTQPTYRKRLFCGMLTFFLAQSTGVLVINNYQVLLYNGLGLHDDMPLLLYALYVTVAALMNVVSAFIIDKVGRRKLIIFGLIACSLDLACEAAMVAKFSGTDNKVGNGLGVLFLFLYVTIYAVTLDATEYVYCAEIFPTHVRAMGMGASSFSQAATTVLYTELAATAFGEIGWKYYLVFIIVPLMGVLLVWKYFPETKGLSLEEIAAAFGEDVVIGRTPTDDQEQGNFDRKLAEDSKDFLAASETRNLDENRKDTLVFAAQVVA